MEQDYTYIVSTRCYTYNQKLYITDALNGFLMQKTELPAVYIVVDDASTDGEREVLLEWAEQHLDMHEEGFAYRKEMPYGELIFGRPKDNLNAHFSILLLRENHRQTGRGRLRWQYIAPWVDKSKYNSFCEGDDYWIDPLKQQKQINYLEEHEECGLCYTDFKYRYGTNAKLSKAAFGEMGEMRPTTFKEHLLNAGYMGPMTWMFRPPIYKQAYETPHIDGTLAIALEFFACSEVGYLEDVTAVYRSHPGSATTQTDPVKKFKYARGVFRTQIEYAIKYGKEEDIVKQLKTQGYASNMLDAVDAKDEDFVKEALEYYKSCGMEMKWFVDKCREYVSYKKKYERIRSSKAYRLGKRLLKPFKAQ